MYRNFSAVGVAMAAACALTWTGCGPKRPETVPVSGRVTYHGKPVAGAHVMFQPEQGRPAVATTGPDGSYRLTTFVAGDGALLGRHRVTIQATRVTGIAQPKSFEEEMRSVGKSTGTRALEWLVPQKYSSLETTPLTAEVKPGENAINFDL